MEFKVGDRLMTSADSGAWGYGICGLFAGMYEYGQIRLSDSTHELYKTIFVEKGCAKPLIRRTWTTTEEDIRRQGRY